MYSLHGFCEEGDRRQFFDRAIEHFLIKTHLRKCITRMQVVKLAIILESARSTRYEPRVGLDENETHFVCIADDDDKDPLGIDSSQLGQPPLPTNLEDHVRQIAREDPGEVY